MSYAQPLNSSTAPVAVTVTASPFTFTAPANGALMVTGGSVSLVQYKRGATVTLVGILGGQIVMAVGDQVTITYLTVPTVTFIPF